jgi:EAL domain-containing protein (putative c-di-GMP-specific phosphodiesterase class I)
VRQAAARLAVALGLRVAGEIGKPLPLERLDMMLTCLPERTSRKQARLPEDLLPAELERGIKNGEIQCLFQPKVRLADRAIVGLEVLTRWRSPTRGLVLPDAFIPLAEKSGLIDLLTHHILTQSLRVFRPWWVAAPELTLAVNLSPLSLTDLTLPERISRTLEASGMPPGQLVLEITEGSVTADYVSAADILTRLRIRGVRVSIDDFGTGYSSLLSLLRLPFNELKIDQSFVRGLCTDPEAAKIVRAVIRLAAELEVQLVAEGIETEEIAVKLAAIGCRIGQGYLFAPPLAASVLADRLAQGGGVDCPVEPPPARAAVI